MNIDEDTCYAPGCQSDALVFGLCGVHFRSGTGEDPAAMSPKPKPTVIRRASICSIDGCEDGVIAKGLCWTHYQRNRRHGDPLFAMRPDSRTQQKPRHVEKDTSKRVS